MKFKPVFLSLLLLAAFCLANPPSRNYAGGLAQLAAFAGEKGGNDGTKHSAVTPAGQLKSGGGDLADLELEAMPGFGSGIFDKYRLPGSPSNSVDKGSDVTLPPPQFTPTPVLPKAPAQVERQTKQVPQAQPDSWEWKAATLNARQKFTESEPDFNLGAKKPAQTIRTEYSEFARKDDFATPLTLSSDSQSMTGRLPLQSIFQSEKSLTLPIAAQAQAQNQPRVLPQAKTQLESLKSTYDKLFTEYKAEMDTLQNLKQKYQTEKEQRQKAESAYEQLRDSLQFQAHEYAQDLTVAKIDAADLLRSRESAKHKIEELRQLDKEQADHLSLLQRKHEYLYGAYELMKTKQQNVLQKRANLTAEKAELTKSEASYEAKLKDLEEKMNALRQDQAAIDQSKQVINQNRQLLENQVELMRKRQGVREELSRKLEQRRLGLEDAQKRLEGVKADYAAKMTRVMTKITELEEVKQKNVEQLKALSQEKETLDFERSKLNERLTLLDKKERVLRQREGEYQFKESICHCRRLTQLNEDDLMVKDPFQVLDMNGANGQINRQIGAYGSGFGAPLGLQANAFQGGYQPGFVAPQFNQPTYGYRAK